MVGLGTDTKPETDDSHESQARALQLQVQTEGLVHLRHDLRRYPTQNWSDAFDGHRTRLLGLSL